MDYSGISIPVPSQSLVPADEASVLASGGQKRYAMYWPSHLANSTLHDPRKSMLHAYSATMSVVVSIIIRSVHSLARYVVSSPLRGG